MAIEKYMEETKKLSLAEVKKIIGEHLIVTDYSGSFFIVYAKQKKDVWDVNIELEIDNEMKESALFSIDVITGEIKKFMKGYMWKF